MTKYQLFISLLGFGILSLTGCSKEENENTTPKEEGSDKIQLTSTVTQTRSLNQSIQTSQLSNGNTVGVYVIDESDDAVCDNVKITADGDGGFTYDQDIFWPVEGKAGIYAYAPYQEEWKGKFDGNNSFSVALDQTTDAGYLASDLLYGVPVNGNPMEQTEKTVALAFHHMLAKVNINVTNSTETDLGGSTVSLTDVATTAPISLKTGALGSASGYGTVKVATFASDATTYRCSAVIMPQKLTNGSSYVGITFKDGTFVTAKMRGDFELLAGKTYNFTINVGVGGADMTAGTSLTDWDDNTAGLTGEIDPDETEEVGVEKLYATFGKPGGNASYTAPTYHWTASTNNLMTIFTFNSGELKKYKKLTFTISNLTSGASVRLGYYVDKTFTEIGSGYYSNGTKEVDLTTLGVDLATVTSIAFGGRSGSEASVDIKATDVFLSGSSSGSGTTSLTATFGKPGGNASYDAPTYTWTASSNNLMTVFEFANGELKNYTTLKFTISNLSSGSSVRMGYYVGSDFKEFGNGFYSSGTKEIDLTALGIDLSTVTKISFGGRNASGSVDIKASDVILTGKSSDGGSSSGGGSSGGGSSSGSTFTATFGTPGGNATYSAPTYTWTASSNNLMTVFEFANGELKNYTTLKFTISNLSSGSSVRMGYYVGSDFKEFGNGFYSSGTKTVDLTALGIDLSTVTKISFGGRNASGSVDIKASDVILSK